MGPIERLDGQVIQILADVQDDEIVLIDREIQHGVQVFGHALHFPLFARRSLGGVEPRSLRLQRFADFVPFANLFGSGKTDPRSDSRAAFHQSVGLQRLQGFGDGQKAHSELGGEFTPGEGSAQGDRAFEDALADRVVGLFGETDTLRGGLGPFALPPPPPETKEERDCRRDQGPDPPRNHRPLEERLDVGMRWQGDGPFR